VLPALQVPSSPSLHILVVDRDPHVTRLLGTILASGGYEAEFFKDGYAALDRARLAPPAVVVTEVLVPRLDGLALCRLLKSDSATLHTKVLVLSMLNAGERALQSGADAFMAKPIERASFLDALRALSLPATPTEEST
jgi:CheY-like chemotaxis protein